MTQQISRQQRRAMERAAMKTGAKPTPAASQLQGQLGEIVSELQNMQTHIVRIVEFNKQMFRSLQILRETVERKGLIVPSDISEVEELYRRSFDKRQTAIKGTLSSDKSDQDKIEMCLEEVTTYKPGYEKLQISPVRDLNVSPAVVNDYLIENGYVGDQYKKYAVYLGVPEAMLLSGDFAGFKSNATQVPGTNAV